MDRPPPKNTLKKDWKPKCSNLPILPSYNKILPASYWVNWNLKTFQQVLPTSSWVSSSRLREVCEQVGYADKNRLEKVCKRLELGADIGCNGRARLPTETLNSRSAYEYGSRVANSLQEWIIQGILVWHLAREEEPWR